MADADPTAQFAQSPSEIASGDARLHPFDWYAEMRADTPIRYDDDRDTWDVFRYADVTPVLDDPETYSSVRATERADDADRPLGQTMISADPPEHERLRSVGDEWFRPGAVRDRRPRIEAVARDVLADVDPDGGFDLVDAYAYPLPVLVIAELLGVPGERRDQFKDWSDTIVASPEDTTSEGLRAFMARRQRAQREMAEFFAGLLDERADDPREDLVSAVAAADSLTRTEKIGFCVLLLIAGNITTTNLIANAVWTLDEQGVLGDVASGAVDRQRAVEEALRFRSPVHAITRVATEETEIAGQAVAAGDRVTVWTGSANRDARAFDAPTEFRPERSPNRHLAFGKGIHHCLGAPLARVEADIALDLLLEAYPDLAVAAEPTEPVQSRIVYGVQALEVAPGGD